MLQLRRRLTALFSNELAASRDARLFALAQVQSLRAHSTSTASTASPAASTQEHSADQKKSPSPLSFNARSSSRKTNSLVHGDGKDTSSAAHMPPNNHGQTSAALNKDQPDIPDEDGIAFSESSDTADLFDSYGAAYETDGYRDGAGVTGDSGHRADAEENLNTVQRSGGDTADADDTSPAAAGHSDDLMSSSFTPSLDEDASLAYAAMSGFENAGQPLANVTSTAMAGLSAAESESVLSAIDMLCDDLYSCKTDVLRAFARTRGITASTKGELVQRLIESAHGDAHGASRDLSVTKRVLGDVFNEDVRTSGLRSAWTNKSLEASHVEMACDRHLRFELMANAQKTMMVRRHAAETARVLRRLVRPFQQQYESIATRAVGGVFRTYKAEADELVRELPVAEMVSPFAAFLVSYVRYGASANLLTRTDVNQRLVSLGLVQPAVESGDLNTLQQLMGLLDDVVAQVETRQRCYGDKRTQWGQETAAVLVSAAQAFSERSHTSWTTELAPGWVHDLARMFMNWESVVRSDVPDLADVPRHFFDCIFNGVVDVYLLQQIYGDVVTPADVHMSIRASLKTALERHFGDDERAASVLHELLAYVQAGGESRGGVRGAFFTAVLSQMQGALHGGEHGALQNERVAVVLQAACQTASRCTRSCGVLHLLVKITEDLRFHYRFSRVFKKLSGADRKTIRTRLSINMVKTLEYFERELHLPPISTKSVAFFTTQMLYLCMLADDGHRPVLQRFTSVLGHEELALVGLTDEEATRVRDLRVAFPPQLSYNSWLSESDTREKSIYNVLPSVAVKGAANQAMLISQAPMVKALDAISRVPWRINKYMLHVQEAIVREGFGFGKIRPGFFPLHYCALSRGDVHHTPSQRRPACLDDDLDDADSRVYNLTQRRQYDLQQDQDWKQLSELRSSRIHYLQALRQARSILQFSHLYFPNSMDFRGRMYPLPGRLNHTGSDPFRALLEYAEAKPLGTVGLYWLKVHLANKLGMSKLSFDERVRYVDEHVGDVVQSAEAPLHGDRWWQEASEPLQCLMACKELADALKCSQGAENYLSRIPVAVDGSYNGLQHYSAIGRDAFGASLVNLVPSDRPADAYSGILKEMLKSIEADAARDQQVAQRCLGSGRGQDKDHIKRKTIKRPIMTQVYGVTGYGMSEQILDELIKQNKSHGLWTTTDMKEMAAYLREKVLESLGVTFRETQNCRRWINEVVHILWRVQPAELRNALCWTTPLGLVVRQPYKVRKECHLFSPHGYTRIPGDSAAPASRKQLSAVAPNLIHSLDATHLAMTSLEMQQQGLSMMAVHDSYWTYACDLPRLSRILREQFVKLYAQYDPLWQLKEQWSEAYFMDLRRHGARLPDPPSRGDLDLNVVLDSPYFFS